MKKKNELRIEKMFFLEYGEEKDIKEILEIMFNDYNMTPQQFADKFIIGYGTSYDLIKKYNIQKVNKNEVNLKNAGGDD